MRYTRNMVIDWMAQRLDEYTDPVALTRDAVDRFGVHPEVAVWDDLLGAATRLMLLKRGGK